MNFLSVFSRIFDGIITTMFNIQFLGISLFEYSCGLSFIALGIAVFQKFFAGDHK